MLGYPGQGYTVPLRMEHGKRRRSATHTAEYRYLLKRLREARKRAGLTQVDVARALRRPQSYVTKCELGERRIETAQPLGVSIYEQVKTKIAALHVSVAVGATAPQ